MKLSNLVKKHEKIYWSERFPVECSGYFKMNWQFKKWWEKNCTKFNFILFISTKFHQLLEPCILSNDHKKTHGNTTMMVSKCPTCALNHVFQQNKVRDDILQNLYWICFTFLLTWRILFLESSCMLGIQQHSAVTSSVTEMLYDEKSTTSSWLCTFIFSKIMMSVTIFLYSNFENSQSTLEQPVVKNIFYVKITETKKTYTI